MDLGNSRNTNDVIKRENNEYQDPEGKGHVPETFNISMGLPRYDCESEASDGEPDLRMDVDDDEEPHTESSVGGGNTQIESPSNYNMKLLADMSSLHPTRQALNHQEDFYPHQHMQQHIGGDKQKQQQQQQQQETNNYNSSTNELTVNNTFPWAGGVGRGASSSVGEPLYLTSTSSALYHHPPTSSYLPSSSSPSSSSSSVKHHHHNDNNRPQEIVINKQQGDSGKFTPELKSPLDQVVTGGGGSDVPAGGQHGSGGNDKQNRNHFQFSNSVDGHSNHQEMDDPPLNDRDKEHMSVLSVLLEDKSNIKDKQQQQQQQQQQGGDNLPDYNHATQHQVYARPMTLPISNDTSVHVQQQQFLSRKHSNDNLYVKNEAAPSAGDGVTNNDVIVANTFSSVTSAAPHQLPSYSTNSMVQFDHDTNFMNFHSNNQHHQQQINFEQTNLHNIANNQQQQQQGNKQQQQEANGSNCGGVGRNRRNSAASLPSPKQQQQRNNKQYQQQIMDHNEYQQQQYQQPSTTTTLIQYGAATSNHVTDVNVNLLLAIANAAANEKLIAEEGGGTSEQQQQLYQQQTNTQQAFSIAPQMIPQFNQQQQQVYLQGFSQQQQQNDQETSAASGDTTTEPPRGGILVVGENEMQHYTTYTNNSIQHNSLSLLAVAAANQDQLATTNQQQQQQQNETELINLTVDELNPSDYPQPADLSTNSHNNDVTGWITSQQQGGGGGAGSVTRTTKRRPSAPITIPSYRPPT